MANSAHDSALPARAGGRPGARRSSRSADQQQAAAAGLDLLRVLGWLVLHDVEVPERPGCPIDHVVVGPSGVYVINDETWSGTVAFREDLVLLDGVPQLDAAAEVGESATAVRGLLGGLPVVGVLCLVRSDSVAGVAGDVAVCSTENILDLLTTQPGLLDTATQQQLARSLRSGLRAVDPRVPQAPSKSRSAARAATKADVTEVEPQTGSSSARHKDPAPRRRLRRGEAPSVTPRHVAGSERPVQPVEGALSPAPVEAPVEAHVELPVEAHVEPTVEPVVELAPTLEELMPPPRVVRAPVAPSAEERRALVAAPPLEPLVAEDFVVDEEYAGVDVADVEDSGLTDAERAAEEAAELAEIEEARLALQAAIEEDRIARELAEQAERAERIEREAEERAALELRREQLEQRRFAEAEARVQAARDRAARESAAAEQVIADRVAADRAADRAAEPAEKDLPARFAGREIAKAPGAPGAPEVADAAAPARHKDRSLRKTLMPALVAALMVVVIAGVVPRVPAAITWVQIQLGKVPTYSLGTSASIGANAYHPALDLRTGAPVATTPVAGAVADGEQLFAVPLRVQNNGSLAWSLPLGTKVEVIDSLGIAHRVAAGITGVEAGRLLPNPLDVSPGHFANGYLPVSLPAGRTVSEVKVDLGGAKGDKVVWKAD
ncbi:NERD domain-containing protein [Marmoricola sp. RAF53]|uniref:nuclease-related domain-containing protein n=1 Tax=Marmoricola sp. RAF53 TaxID=3233059 RepID=UPI003F9974D1